MLIIRIEPVTASLDRSENLLRNFLRYANKRKENCVETEKQLFLGGKYELPFGSVPEK